MIRLSLPRPPAWPELLQELRERPKAPVLVEVPEGWCYRVQRGGPLGGWKASMLESLRPGLFPEPLENLHWDEDLGEDGTWRAWALSSARLEAALGGLSEPLWTAGRRVRVRPAGTGEEGLEAFPNLAPGGFRGRRIPWGRLRRGAARLGPFLAAAAALLLVGLRLHGGWARLEARLRAEEQAVRGMDRQAQAERQVLAVLRGQASRRPEDPAWLTDLDALTRLLPEDTRLAKLEWAPGGLQLDLLTPHPERIQEILEASPEFKGVRFVGNLERQGELSRLTLHCQSEAER